MGSRWLLLGAAVLACTRAEPPRPIVSSRAAGDSCLPRYNLPGEPRGTKDPRQCLLVGRSGHTATLLGDGTVLLVGGTYDDRHSVERYDPRTGTSRVAAPLLPLRSRHTATLLPDGRVLVAGGQPNDRANFRDWLALDQIQLYDPRTDAWSAGPNLPTPRAVHTATLVDPDLLVLAGGSASRWIVLDTIDVLRVSTLKFSDNPEYLRSARWYHTATLVGDGKLLLVGGYGQSFSQPPDPDIYDVRARTSRLTSGSRSVRSGQTATVLRDGRVLMVGGQSYDDEISGNDGLKGFAEVYDPMNGRWQAAEAPKHGRRKHTATVMHDGQVLVAGGTSDEGMSHPSGLTLIERYDPATGRWDSPGHLAVARFSHTATLLPDGRVLIAGGWSGEYPVPEVEILALAPR